MNGDISHEILKGWNVLVVDDEMHSLDIATIVLEHYSATVHTASNGREALEVIRKIRPKLIISDISMPIMNGWEFIAALKKDRGLSDIPAIALTAHAQVGDRERAIAAGFHNYLSKPLTPLTFMQDLLFLLEDIPELAQDLSR
jgi:CheY-like chemotaxis protein